MKQQHVFPLWEYSPDLTGFIALGADGHACLKTDNYRTMEGVVLSFKRRETLSQYEVCTPDGILTVTAQVPTDAPLYKVTVCVATN